MLSKQTKISCCNNFTYPKQRISIKSIEEPIPPSRRTISLLEITYLGQDRFLELKWISFGEKNNISPFYSAHFSK